MAERRRKTTARATARKAKKARTKSETVPVRMRAEDKRRMTEAAEAEGLGLSTWLRRLGLREAGGAE